MSVSGSQEARYRPCATNCGNDSDYAVLHVYMNEELFLCRSCWNEEEHIRIDDDTTEIFRPHQVHTVRLRCLRCNADVTVQKGCTGCFPAG